MAHSHDHSDQEHSGHAHNHGHDHGHNHGHGLSPGALDRAFAIGAVLNGGFVVAEVVFGLAANSLALLADAAHNLGDVLGLLIAWGAVWLGRRAPTHARTYGYGRSSILASLVNAVVLLISVGAIAIEAVQRFSAPQPVAEGTVIVVAAIGILINGGTALLFMSGRKRDINVEGAFLHMAADAAVSLGVVVAAIAIGVTGWLWLDPATSLVIAAVVTWGTWGLLKSAVNLAMDAVPAGIDRGDVEAHLRALPGVCEVHDLHIWALSTTETAITAHLVVLPEVAADTLTAAAAREVKETFAIGHATFQVESQATAADCALAPDHVV
jgi:cobalt-zinc-cadmium efflux system protein